MRMLIVEDDLDGREMLTELFRSHDWVVTAVPTVGAGLDALRAGGFDVIISDENLEGESGSSMLREASDEGLLGGVGALLYTAEPRTLDVPSGVRILHKPLAVGVILEEATAIAPESGDGPLTPRSVARLRTTSIDLDDAYALDSGGCFGDLVDDSEAVRPPSRRAR